jgi:hypothetical protein
LRFRDEGGEVQRIMQQSAEPANSRGKRDRGRETAGRELPMER